MHDGLRRDEHSLTFFSRHAEERSACSASRCAPALPAADRPRLAGPAATVLLALLALGGCAWRLDPDEMRLCRTALPALEAGASEIRVTAIAGPRRHSVRIDYEAVKPSGLPVAGFALCDFAAARPAVGPPDLVRLATRAGEVSGASLFLLKHYYIETPDSLMAAPDSDLRVLSLPQLPPSVAYAAQTALLAAPRAVVYALLAAAYALVYGLLGRINLAFGEIAAIAAAALGLTMAALAATFDAAPLMALPLGLAAAVAAGAIHAAVAGHVTLMRLRAAHPQASLIATLGAALALMEYLRLAQGTRPNWLPALAEGPIAVARAGSFVVTIVPEGLATTAAGLAALLALLLAMRRSRFGRAWRAYADDAFAAALFGLDGSRLVRRTLALAGAAAGFAAALVVVQFGALGFADGFSLGLKALLASILGGIGSVPAAALGGLCIGLFESLWSAYWPIEARDGATLAVLVLVLVLRPGGLFAMPAPPSPRL